MRALINISINLSFIAIGIANFCMPVHEYLIAFALGGLIGHASHELYREWK